ncbi:hypothetical protein [Pleurocapsa sp. PCC 7319]|uniref:hypothetical protein n=1 Tax=Pleurocapsa sp. PCC 7319 TaxID=118161 RepID=UPI001181999B|nr:hypothetical protein [Pleurocapsa sp. PCC 7319]
MNDYDQCDYKLVLTIVLRALPEPVALSQHNFIDANEAILSGKITEYERKAPRVSESITTQFC